MQKYAAYILAKLGNEVLSDPELQGRIVGFVVYQVAEGIVTAGIAELALPAKLASLLEKVGSQLKTLKTGAGKADELLEIAKLLRSSGRLDMPAKGLLQEADAARAAKIRDLLRRKRKQKLSSVLSILRHDIDLCELWVCVNRHK